MNETKKADLNYYLKFNKEKVYLLFPINKNATIPLFQRAIGTSSGTIIECNKKGNGIIKIDDIEYTFKDNREFKFKKIFPLEKFINKEINFSFYPTITKQGIKLLKLKPNDKPILKIANLKKQNVKNNYIEILGNIVYIGKNHFTVSVYSNTQKKQYIVNISGKIESNNLLGYFVKLDCVLENGLIAMKDLLAFPYKKEIK